MIYIQHLSPVAIGIFFTSIFSFICSICVLIYPKAKSQENILASFFFFESIWLFLGGLSAMGLASPSPSFLFKISLLFYFFAVLSSNLYFIVATTPDFKFRPVHLMNLIIPIMVIVLFFFEKKTGGKSDFLSLYYTGSDKYLLSTVSSITLAFYSILVLYNFYKMLKDRRREFSMSWQLVIRLLILTIVQTALWVADKVSSAGYLWHLYLFSGLTIIYIAFLAIRHPEMLHSLKDMGEKRQYAKTRINNIDIDSALQQLDRYMKTEKPYKDTGLSLNILAGKLDFTPHQLSELLNSHLQKNFFVFVNSYRIEDARQTMMENPGKTLIQIAHEVGFDSVSTFNRVFKTQTGETPSAVRKKLLCFRKDPLVH